MRLYRGTTIHKKLTGCKENVTSLWDYCSVAKRTGGCLLDIRHWHESEAFVSGHVVRASNCLIDFPYAQNRVHMDKGRQ